jgi:hypothetical protein
VDAQTDRYEVVRMSTFTHGSPARPPRPLSAGLLVVDVAALVTDLREEASYQADGRDSETIVSDGPARVIVTVLEAGMDLGAERSDGHVMLLLVEGSGALGRDGAESPMTAGSLAVLAPGEPWSLRADTRSAVVASFWQPG